jgi:hypothetical protein
MEFDTRVATPRHEGVTMSKENKKFEKDKRAAKKAAKRAGKKARKNAKVDRADSATRIAPFST